MIEGSTMHVRDAIPVEMIVDTCPERDVILWWRCLKDGRNVLIGDSAGVEVSAEQAIEYAHRIIETAQFVFVRRIMMS